MGRSKELDLSSGEMLVSDVSLVGGPYANALMNPDGSPRGGISAYASVSDDAFVDVSATVLAGASIQGRASVKGVSIIGAGVVVGDEAEIVNANVLPMTPSSMEARVKIYGNAKVENFHIYGISVEIFGDAWVCGIYEADVRSGTGKNIKVGGGYEHDELIDGGFYGGSRGGTTKADLLSDDGVEALKNWLLSLPPTTRAKHEKELAALMKRVGGGVDTAPLEAPVYRFVNTLDGRYVVPVSQKDLYRVEDLLKSGASFHEIAKIYEIDDDALFTALEHHVGYNPFALWDKFVCRPVRVNYSLHVPSEKGFLFSVWRAVDPQEHQVWETEKRSIENGLLYEFDFLPEVKQLSVLDRPPSIKWQQINHQKFLRSSRFSQPLKTLHHTQNELDSVSSTRTKQSTVKPSKRKHFFVPENPK